MPWEPKPQTYLSGNTAGTTHVFGPVVTLQGSNVTLSGSGNKIVIIGAGAATQTVAGSAAISAGTQSVSTGTVKFADSNGVTFGMSGSSQITATVKTDYLTAQSAFVFSASNGLGWGTNGSTITGSYTVPNVPAQTNQTLGLYALGNTTGESSSSTFDARTVSFKGFGIASLGYSSGSVVVSVPSPAAQTNQTLGFYAVGNTAGESSSSTLDARTISYKGLGIASVGYSNSSVLVSVPAAAAQTVQPALNAASAGTASISGVTLKFADSGGVTWGLNTGANSSVLTATVKTDYLTTARGSTDAIGLNTAKTNVTWTVNSSGLSFDAGGYAGTVTGATNASVTANTSGVSVNVPNTAVGTNTAQTNVTWTVNTSGISFNAGGYAGTVSGATNCSVTVNTSGVSVNVPNPLISRLVAYPRGLISSSQATNASISFAYLFVPSAITFTRVDFPALISLASSATTNTGNLVITSGAAIYTRNGSTFNPIVGQTGSTTYTWASNTANFNSISGARPLSFGLATTLSAGEYWVGVQLSTTNNSSIGASTTLLANSISMLLGSLYTASGFAEFGALTNATTDIVPGFGLCSVTMSNTTQTYQFSHITATGAQAARGNLFVVLRNF